LHHNNQQINYPMSLKRAVDFGNEFMKKHPQFKAEVRDYFQLMKDEIEEGGSTEHEINLFIGSCEDLLTQG
jgi:hypothetical protein